MSRRCVLKNDKAVLFGNKISHSNRKSTKEFRPNIQSISFYSDALEGVISLNASTSSIRDVEHNGGIDNYLLTSRDSKLSRKALMLKKRIQGAIENKAQ
jgi:large subunit ribosomal protein L28